MEITIEQYDVKGRSTMYKLVIIEDRNELRQSLRNFIAWDQMGFEVCADFGDGQQGLKYLLQNPVDVVLCDICMPVMDGIELARCVKDAGLQTMIVFLSAHKDFEYARSAMSLGIKDYIIKPAVYDDFAATFIPIKEYLDKQRFSLSEQENEEDITFSSFHEKIIFNANNFVKNNYRNVTLESVAKHLNINPHYFSRLYKKITHENFSDYVTQIKMTEAARLLNDVRLRTHDISDMLGYSNANNFARAFKKYYNLSPSEYRNQNENGISETNET